MNFDFTSFFLGILIMTVLMIVAILIIYAIMEKLDFLVERCYYDSKKPESIEEIQAYYKEQYCTFMITNKITSKSKKKRLIKAIKKAYQNDVDYFESPKKIKDMLKEINGGEQCGN